MFLVSVLATAARFNGTLTRDVQSSKLVSSRAQSGYANSPLDFFFEMFGPLCSEVSNKKNGLMGRLEKNQPHASCASSQIHKR